MVSDKLKFVEHRGESDLMSVTQEGVSSSKKSPSAQRPTETYRSRAIIGGWFGSGSGG